MAKHGSESFPSSANYLGEMKVKLNDLTRRKFRLRLFLRLEQNRLYLQDKSNPNFT